MRKIQSLLFILLLALPLLAGRYALLVGNNKATGDLAELKYVKNDLKEMQDVLVRNCGFSSGNVVELYNKSPLELVLAIRNYQKSLKKNETDLFFFYYSGHANHRDLLMGELRMNLGGLKDELKKVTSDVQIVVLDACQSGSFSRLKGGAVEKPFLFKHEDNIEGQVVLYSSSDNEYSQESDLFKHSVFTFHLLNALRGCADQSGDKLVTLNEAYQYSYNQTVTTTLNSLGGIQHPGYLFDIKGKGDVVLSDMTNKRSGIILGADIHGSIAILNGSNDLVADLAKKSGRQVFISLIPGRYTVYTNSGDYSAKARVVVKGDATQYLQNGNFNETKSVPIYSKGGSRKIKKDKNLLKVQMRFGAVRSSNGVLDSSLEASYDYYKDFGLQYNSPLENNSFNIGLGVEYHFKNGVLITNQFNHCSFIGEFTKVGEHKPDPMLQGAPITFKDYSQLYMSSITLMVGYRFKQGPLKNMGLLAGGEYIRQEMSETINVTDEFLNLKSESYIDDKQKSLTPAVGLSYSFPVSEVFELNLQSVYSFGLYRDQGIDDAKYHYSFSRIRGDVGLTFILNGKR